MKRINSIITLFMLSVIAVNAQDCKVYIPNTVGKEIELTTYDKKDNPTSIIKQTLKEIKQSADTTIFYMYQYVTDDKGKNPMESNYSFKCLGNVFFIDMDMYFDQKTMEAYKDMQMKITASEIDMPAQMDAGQKLKDGFMKMEIMAGVMPITMKVDIINRLVEGFENITTSAGTFSCVKISQDVKGNFGFVKTNFHTITWYSEKIGTVRSENYKQEKLESYMVLTNIKE